MTSKKFKRKMRQPRIQNLASLLMLLICLTSQTSAIGIPDFVDSCKDEKYNNTYYYDTTRFECRPCGPNAVVNPTTSKLNFLQSDIGILQDAHASAQQGT